MSYGFHVWQAKSGEKTISRRLVLFLCCSLAREMACSTSIRFALFLTRIPSRSQVGIREMMDHGKAREIGWF